MNKIVLSLMITALSTGATLSAQTNPGSSAELQTLLNNQPTRDSAASTTTSTNQLSSRLQELMTVSSNLESLSKAANNIYPGTKALNQFVQSTMQYFKTNLGEDNDNNNLKEVPFVNKLLTTLTNMLTSPAGTNNFNQVLSFTNQIGKAIGNAVPGESVFSMTVATTLKTYPEYATINTNLEKGPVEPITMEQLIEYGSSPANVTGYLMTNFPKDVMQITPNDRTQFQAVVAKLAGQPHEIGLPYLNAIQNVVKAGASLAQFRSLITPLSGASIAQSIQLNYDKLRATTFPHLPKIGVSTPAPEGLPQANKLPEKNIGSAVIPGSMNQ